MRFMLVDRVLELEPGQKITTLKTLSLAEEYLADHFPRFPVMPGVLMLEAMTHAGAWLVRASEDFAHSMVLLKEARNIKYAKFVAPGQVLTVTAELIKQDERETHLKALGAVAGEPAVMGRLVLERFNLADERPEMSDVDAHLKQQMRHMLSLLYQPTSHSTADRNGAATHAGVLPAAGQ
jgi:3-hydroxyacyl-[acyl-carrier-protein] dehydratase